MVAPYKIDPDLEKMKSDLLNEINSRIREFDRDEMPIVLGICLAIGYVHEIFRVCEVISNQLDSLIVELEGG